MKQSREKVRKGMRRRYKPLLARWFNSWSVFRIALILNALSLSCKDTSASVSVDEGNDDADADDDDSDDDIV